MPTIHLTTFIAAPANVVFDLSRHVSVHKEAHVGYKIEAVAGTRFGLLEKGETITWKSYHLFKERLQRIKIVEMIKPEMYVEVQLQGDLSMFRHEHHFKEADNGSFMIDLVEFETPYGFIGRLLNKYYLVNYLEKLITQRNTTIRAYAESEQWKTILN